ncbi:hypothetical protein ACLMJK_002461 [Lecanora helva]
MLALPSFVALLLSVVPFLANPVDARPKGRRILSRQTTDQPCDQIFNSDYDLFAASLAYQCLLSAPFNSTVALEFLQYYNDTLQFQSTLTYLKNPPPSYQQPPVDLIGSLTSIQQRVQAGQFQTQYAFEVAVQEVVHAAHDDHLTLTAGILGAFTFGSPLRIVSASTDGIALPEIYIADDLIEAIDQNVSDWTPSAVSTINGQDVVAFLTQFAVINTPGNVEPQADWNDLMSSPAGDVQGLYSAFEGNTIFYPGENITFNFANGSTTGNLPWLALYSSSVGDSPPSISTGQDLYDYFVLGEIPQSNSTAAAAASTTVAAAASTSYAAASSTIAEAAATATDSTEATPSNWDYFPAYPNDPIVSQSNLGLLDGGVVSGYFLNDGITAILSIPSFDVTVEAVASFSTTIGDFLQKSENAGRTRVIVDLQRNDGGGNLLAIDAFKHFFPTIDPFGGSRLRAHPFADALGNTFTTYFTTQDIDPDFYDQLASDIWVAPVFLNAATGQNFTSWPEFFGPHLEHGDYFTTAQRNNLSSVIFDENALGDDDESNGLVVFGFANRTTTAPPPYKPEQLVLLTDAFCSSACATFVELMHHQAGVRTVVAGGRPELGPMQAVGGNRGAQSYTAVDIDEEIEVAEILNTSVTDVLPDRSVGGYISFAEFNIKDAVRPGEQFPLQFAYEAATCRIFYTQHTVYNYLNLWNYVVDAIWRNPALCVDGSANGTTILPTNTTGPVKNGKDITNGNSKDIGSLILSGLSSGPVDPQPSSQPEKRDNPPPTSTSDALASHHLSHKISDGLDTGADCSTCNSRRGLANVLVREEALRATDPKPVTKRDLRRRFAWISE